MHALHLHLLSLPRAAWHNLRRKPTQLFLGACAWAIVGLVVRLVLSGLLDALDKTPLAPPPSLLWEIAATYVLMLCVWIVMCTFYLILVACDPHSFVKNARHTMQLIGPMAWLLLVVFVRSFSWMAFLGFLLFHMGAMFEGIGSIVFCAGLALSIIRLPRFFLAPFFLVHGRTVRESVSLSLEKTYGRWRLIAVSLLAVLVTLGIVIVVFGSVVYQLLSIPLAFVHSSVASVISLVCLMFFALSLQYAWQLLQVFGLACCVELADALQRSQPSDKKKHREASYETDVAASTMRANSSASKEDAPTSPPSTSGSANKL